jgi:eukaryotic-like serine/threonine-protein kinase
MVGELIAERYELEELVGSGGMSSVYKAHDRLLDRYVALKILHEYFGSDDEYVERFRREARSVAQLSHPNIVTVIDRGESDGRQYIVFEFIDGESLKEIVDRTGPLPVDDALALGVGVARALAFAHERGLVHRDVKPQNVILNGDGRPKVTDFGIARSLDLDKGMTATGTVLGTSNYIAPEQASGQPVDEQTDVYSLGVVLFELLTGDVPFEGDSFVAVALRHINEPPPSILERRGDVPPRVAAAVDRALAKDPRDRFPSMDAFAAELEACLAELRQGSLDQGATVVTRPIRPRSRATQRRRSPWPLLLALVALLALAVIAVAAVALRSEVPDVSDAVGGGSDKLKPVQLLGVAAYDPEGGDDEHSEAIPRAIDADPSTYWTTQHYQAFTKSGVGFVVQAPGGKLKRLTLTSDTPGFIAQVKASGSASGGFVDVSDSKTVGARTRFDLEPSPGPYYLIWLTQLPPGSDAAHVNGLKALR